MYPKEKEEVFLESVFEANNKATRQYLNTTKELEPLFYIVKHIYCDKICSYSK